MLHPIRRLIALLPFALLCTPGHGLAAEAELTRFGPARYAPDILNPNVSRRAFFAVPGPGRLTIEPLGPQLPGELQIHLNGRKVFYLDKRDPAAGLETAVELAGDNVLRVELAGYQGDPVQVRVTQPADVELHLTGRVHFNVNTLDYDATREFYRALGFAHAVGPFPESNTLEVSHGVGIREIYKMHAELIFLGEADERMQDLLVPQGRFIDLVEWKHPRNTAPAYGEIYHLGITRVRFTTTDLDADMQRLQKAGAEFLSGPARYADGSRFAVTRDPAGTFVELMEPPGAEPVEVLGSFVSDVHSLTVNVSDFERAREFYRMLGFTSGTPLPETQDPAVARAMGLEAPFRIRGEMLEHEADGSRIELIQWLSPGSDEPPHPAPITYRGIQRINYATTDLLGDIARLKAQGVQFLSPIAPCCEGERSSFAFILFPDPDGNYFQIMGPIDPDRER